jgi:1-acyl-sn-glycerol-3-phosphate acyltransferase
VFAIAARLPKRARFVAKKELGTIPIFGRAWKAAGHISVDRRNHAEAVAALQEAGRTICQDHSAVVIFPEGTRSPTGQLLPFKKGGFMMALVTGVEIVPTAVLGTRAILPRDSWRVHGGRITLRFAPPVATAAYHEGNRDELIARVRREIEQLLTPALARGSEDEPPGPH